MMNEMLFKYSKWSVLIYAIILVIGVYWILGTNMLFYATMINILVLYFFLCFVTILKIFYNYIVISHPFRFFKRKIVINICDIKRVKFCYDNGKAAPQFIMFYCENQAHKVYLESWYDYQQMLNFFESKNIEIEKV